MDYFTYPELINLYSRQKAERLAYIDFTLRFLGGLNRSDLLEFFGIADAAASKEISEYRALRPNNVEYDRVKRKNVILRSSFEPLIDISAELALGMLANGFNKNKLYAEPMLPYQRIGSMPNHLKPEVISKITRAIYSRTALRCNYHSGTSLNYAERTLLPTAFIFNGQKWVFRAFDRDNPIPEKRKFKFFDFSRVIEAEELTSTYAEQSETIEQDMDWHLIVPLQLGIHPRLSEKQKSILIRDFGLKDGALEFVHTEKAVLVYFLIKNWKVDLSETDDEAKKNDGFNFHLKNAASLKHLDCMENLFKD